MSLKVSKKDYLEINKFKNIKYLYTKIGVNINFNMLNIILKRNFENIHSMQKNLISTNLKKKAPKLQKGNFFVKKQHIF